MKYLESCIDGRTPYIRISLLLLMSSIFVCPIETLRKYPPLPLLNRECTKEYQLPGTNVVIEKGTAIFIPAMGIQRDEKYFADPIKFDPDRFSEKNAIPSMSYLPFGDGPRNCIGLRLGKMQTKVALILMMQHCRFDLGDAQYYNEELPFSPAAIALAPECGINLKIRPR